MVPEGLVREGSLDDVLAVVERPLDADAVDVLVGNGGHLPLLDLAHAALREHDEAVHMRLAPEPVDGGRPCACTRTHTHVFMRMFNSHVTLLSLQLSP